MNWLQLLEDNGVPYVTRGPNTKRGEVSIKCVFCGEDDPSEHLGINLTTENWGCHRNAQHRGKSPVKLIAALLGCNWGQAKLVAAQYSVSDPETLDQALAALLPLSEAPKAVPGQALDTPHWRTIDRTGATAKYWRYLASRGFADVGALVRQYGLTCCLTGRFKDRVIIPFHQQGELVGWTGRAIVDPVSAPRYLSSGEAIKTTIFNEDELYPGGKLLLLVEGPFDALKLDHYGRALGTRATCVFGTSMSMDQISILVRLRKLYKKVVVLFDPEAIEPAFAALDWLHAPNVTLGHLPDGIEDPGAMTEAQVHRFISSTLKG